MSIGYVLRALREAGQQSGTGWLDVSEECSGPGAKGKRRLLLFMNDPTIPGEATGDGGQRTLKESSCVELHAGMERVRVEDGNGPWIFD